MNTLYDVNTFIGHWPFRQLTDSSPKELRKLLESYGIEKALTANINSIFYKDSQSGNQELFDGIAEHRDFFTGVAILNPTYVAWERDLEKCVNEFGFKALRIVPQYHNYSIGDKDCLAICKKAADLNIPVLISPAMIDVRQAHWMDTKELVSYKQVCDLVEQVEDLRVVVSHFIYDENEYDILAKKDYCKRVFFDTSRCLSSVFYQRLAHGVKALGAERFVYGSNAPFRGISTSVLELEDADISDTEKETIATETFSKLFG